MSVPRVLATHRACSGLCVVFGERAVAARDRFEGEGPDAANARLAVAAHIAELEAAGERVTTLSIHIQSRTDLPWADTTLRFAWEHGRRALVRTSALLPTALLETLRSTRAVLLLSLAHERVYLQRALLGQSAAPAASLLLQAQHSAALGIATGAVVGPLFPGVHDDEPALDRLLSHVAAAQIEQVRAVVGQLGAGRARALDDALGVGPQRASQALTRLRRAFKIEADTPMAGYRKLDARSQAVLLDGFRRRARTHGLMSEGCGCTAFCQLADTPRHYLPVLEADLFGARTGS